MGKHRLSLHPFRKSPAQDLLKQKITEKVFKVYSSEISTFGKNFSNTLAAASSKDDHTRISEHAKAFAFSRALHIHLLSMVLALTLILLLSLTNPSQARPPHKRLIIHVPFRIKTHHHTHTVYAHIRSTSSSGGSKEASREHGGGAKQTIYKIVSLAMQGKGYDGHTGHGGHGGHGQAAHKRGHSSSAGNGRYEQETHSQGVAGVMYDDYHGGGRDGGGDERAGRCIDGPHGYGDMVFNHFSRSSDESNESDEYPEVAEYVDEDEQGFVWE